MPILSLGYVRLDVENLDKWRTFLGDFLDMMEVKGGQEDSAYFRMDEYPPRLVVRSSTNPGLEAVGFEVLNRQDLAEMVARVEAAGIAVTAGSDTECAERRVSGFVKFLDPGGNPIELFYGPVLDHVRVVMPHVSSFVTGDQGLGHIILDVPDTEAAFEFYSGVLGFADRNTLVLPSGTLYFLGCNPRQHTLGLSPGKGPGLAHVMVEGAELDDLGRALDRAEELGIPMMQSLGRHTNDLMVSFYVYSPEGHAIEMGWGGQRIEGPASTYRITEGAVWGHRFTPPPAAG